MPPRSPLSSLWTEPGAVTPDEVVSEKRDTFPGRLKPGGCICRVRGATAPSATPPLISFLGCVSSGLYDAVEKTRRRRLAKPRSGDSLSPCAEDEAGSVILSIRMAGATGPDPDLPAIYARSTGEAVSLGG